MTHYEERMRTMICRVSSTRPPTHNETMLKNVALFLLLVFFIGWRLYLFTTRGVSFTFIITLLLFLVVFYWFIPRTKVTVTDEAVTIKRGIGVRNVRIDDILNVSIVDSSLEKGIYEFNAAHPGAKIYAHKNVNRGVAFELIDGKAILICSATPDAFKAAVSLAQGKWNRGASL